MKLFTHWGFSRESWRGTKGEYLVLLQGILMVGFVLLPVYGAIALPPILSLITASISVILAVFAAVLLVKGLLDLGQSLTPLPYPRSDGELVQTGVYAIVRHSLYSGIILMAIAYTLWTASLSHAIATIILFIFFDRKAAQEERWLSEKYPDYSTYQQRVKKLLPWMY